MINLNRTIHHLLKTLLILFVFMFSNCKKDEILKTEIKKEEWRPISKELIYWGDRNIIASYSNNNNISFLTPYINYVLDNDSVQNRAEGYNVPGFYKYGLYIAWGNNHRVWRNFDNSQILIADNFLDCNTNLPSSYFLPYNDLEIQNYTAPDSNSNWYVAISAGKAHLGDSSSVYLNKYSLSSGKSVQLDFKWSSLIYPKKLYNGWGITSLNAINEFVYMSGYGFTYRILDGLVTDTLPFNLIKIVNTSNVLYANCATRTYLNPFKEYPAGLLKSVDNGKTWNYIGTGGSFQSGNLTRIDDKIFLYTGDWIIYCDLQNSVIKTMDVTGINGKIRTLNKFKNRIYVGTDAGVYSKTYKAFMEE